MKTTSATRRTIFLTSTALVLGLAASFAAAQGKPADHGDDASAAYQPSMVISTSKSPVARKATR